MAATSSSSNGNGATTASFESMMPSTDQLSEWAGNRNVWIGVAVTFVFLLWLRGRGGDDTEKHARRLVRDWREVDSLRDGREHLESNLLPLLRPILLAVLREAEGATIDGMHRLEKRVKKL